MKHSQNLSGVDEENGVVWVRKSVLFDRLPLEGLGNLSLRFELCGPGEVWLDQIKLYKLILADTEQTELMKTISAAEFRLAKNRLTDVLFILDGYTAKLLKEEIKGDSPLLAARAQRPPVTARLPSEKESESSKKSSVFNRTLKRIKLW